MRNIEIYLKVVNLHVNTQTKCNVIHPLPATIQCWLVLLEEKKIIAVKIETANGCSSVLPAQLVFSDCNEHSL